MVLLSCTVFNNTTATTPSSSFPPSLPHSKLASMPERKFGLTIIQMVSCQTFTANYYQVHIVFVIISGAAFACFPLQTIVNVLNGSCFQIQEGLSPNHLKKAKLMFFYTRYPSSNMLKMFFSDVKVSPNTNFMNFAKSPAISSFST